MVGRAVGCCRAQQQQQQAAQSQQQRRPAESEEAARSHQQLHGLTVLENPPQLQLENPHSLRVEDPRLLLLVAGEDSSRLLGRRGGRNSNLGVDSPDCNKQQQYRASNPNCEADDARELGLCSFAFQLCLFATKLGHTRVSADRRTLICEAAYERELGLFCFCFPSLFLY